MPQNNIFRISALLAGLPMRVSMAYSQAFSRKWPEVIQRSVAGAADPIAESPKTTSSNVGVGAPSSSESEPPRRKPGRPKKATAPETSETAAPKRKPGRPRKTAAAKKAEESTPAAPQKRKPGRPRKAATSPSNAASPESKAADQVVAAAITDRADEPSEKANAGQNTSAKPSNAEPDAKPTKAASETENKSASSGAEEAKSSARADKATSESKKEPNGS